MRRPRKKSSMTTLVMVLGILAFLSCAAALPSGTLEPLESSGGEPGDVGHPAGSLPSWSSSLRTWKIPG